MKKIKAGIVGSAGYTGGEAIRILLTHPNVEISFAHSNSQAGKPVYAIHADLFGSTDLTFTAECPLDDVDVIFLCMGHGKSKEFMNNTPLSPDLKIVDLSHDFRLHEFSEDFVYGLPEFQREEIKNATRIANPGCFATAIQLALLPLAKNNLLTDEVHIQATTGSTGAGQKPTATSHFSWRNNNISVYKAFEHQHLGEISETLTSLQPSFDKEINFVPVRGNFTRGIMAVAYTQYESRLEEGLSLYQNYYKEHPFVFVSEVNPDLKMVVNTNKCVLHLAKHRNKLMIISMIDNLTKGASGQAVQNMNLLFGLPETTGLELKGNAF